MPENVVFNVPIPSPSIIGLYLFSVADQTGEIAAKNYMTIFNPVGSGKLIAAAAFFISSYSVGQATATEPLRGHRITSASGGTLANNATDTVKFNTSHVDTVMELRSGNPTVGGMGAAFFNSPPPIGTGAGTAFVHHVEPPAGSGPFLVKPGEGIVIRTASGDIDQHFNLTVAWAEVNI